MLFRLIQNPEFTGQQLLGYDWIEVLAAEPWAIVSQPKSDLGDWADAEITMHYVCRVPGARHEGETTLIRLAARDLWTALGEEGGAWRDEEGRAEYIEDRGKAFDHIPRKGGN